MNIHILNRLGFTVLGLCFVAFFYYFYFSSKDSRDLSLPTKEKNHLASHFSKNIEHIKKLIDEGSYDINMPDEKYGRTPLHYACITQKLDLAQLLVEKGANIQKGEDENFQPIHYCASMGNIEIMDYLIKKGASVNAKNDANWTPLHEAVERRHPKAASFLINQGAILNTQDKDFLNTPLHIAVYEDFPHVVNLLLKNGANTNLKNYQNKTPLEYIKSDEMRKVVKFYKNSK